MKFANKLFLLGALAFTGFSAYGDSRCDDGYTKCSGCCECKFFENEDTFKTDPRLLEIAAFIEHAFMLEEIPAYIADRGEIIAYKETETTLDTILKYDIEIPTRNTTLKSELENITISARGNKIFMHTDYHYGHDCNDDQKSWVLLSALNTISARDYVACMSDLKITTYKRTAKTLDVELKDESACPLPEMQMSSTSDRSTIVLSTQGNKLYLHAEIK